MYLSFWMNCYSMQTPFLLSFRRSSGSFSISRITPPPTAPPVMPTSRPPASSSWLLARFRLSRDFDLINKRSFDFDTDTAILRSYGDSLDVLDVVHIDQELMASLRNSFPS